MDEQEIPVLGPVTVTWTAECAAEVAMVLQHILHNIPTNPRPDQAARAYTLGEAAIALSGALVQAMRDAGLSERMIARASGHLIQAVPENNAQMELQEEARMMADEARANRGTHAHDEPMPDDQEVATPHPLDAPDEPHNPSPPVDFPTPGGPPDAA
jgi:hypothetical protein